MEYKNTYIAVDLKSFYASVECRERGLDPLTTKLVVADSSRTNKTICLAVTPALKAYGLSGRCRLFEVEQKAREVKRQSGKDLEYIIAPPRMALYIKYSSRIYNVYLKYFAPEDIHVYSIDEVFIDATSYLKLYKTGAKDLVAKVIQEILSETGITATAGIAPNLYLCKIAMDIVAKHIPADKDGVRIAELDEISYRQKLWDHRPLTDFWRIGKGIARRLESKFIYTMGDIAKISLKNERLLYDEFGIDAEILIDHAWGYEPVRMKDIKNYKSSAKSLGSGQVLHCPYDYEKTKIVVREMADSLSMSLFEKNLVASSLCLDCFYDVESLSSDSFDGELVRDYYGRSVPKPAHGSASLGQDTNSAAVIIEALMNLFERIGNKNYLYRKISVCANGVIPLRERQATLFDEEAKNKKEKSLQQARLDIIKKFGKNAMLKGTDYEEGATMIERNAQIGGHKA
ncbi:MAG: DNA methylase [Treponema sp.]|nr:DNA methylase [Treponema sp.]